MLSRFWHIVKKIIVFFKKKKQERYGNRKVVDIILSADLKTREKIMQKMKREEKDLFERCMPTIWNHEGGYVDNPNDTGGKTKYGVSLLFLKGTKDLDGDGFLDGDINKDGIINSCDVKQMSREHAKHLYKMYFWNKNYKKIDKDLLVLHLFDMAINAGNKRSAMLIQDVVCTKVDGIIGKKTIKAINDMLEITDVVFLYKQKRIEYYKAICDKYPKNLVFLDGWMNRVEGTKFLV